MSMNQNNSICFTLISVRNKNPYAASLCNPLSHNIVVTNSLAMADID